MKNSNSNNQKNKLSDDIDSGEDKARMKREITEINLPGVEDIPGQENIKPAPLGDLADVTASSADEEGDDIFNDDLDEAINSDPDSNVSPQEKRGLHIAANDMPGDDENLRDAALDNTDEDGTPLNEGSFDKNISPNDLDIPGAKQDDASEAIGAEDEENNAYSLGGDDNEDAPRDDF